MKIVTKKDRKLLLINTGNTQNENKAETIELTVPEEYEDYNKKIVFVTDDGIVWDIIQDNTYKLTKAITKYKQVDFYIWLTKDDVDFRTETRPLRFYYNKDASDEITPEEISGVNTVVNILEEEITKVDSLETELRALITDIQNKLDNGEFDGEDGYTPQKGIDYFTEQDIEEIETDVKNDLEENVLVNYSLIAETGAKIELSINTTDYKLKAILKDKNNNIIHTSNVIDLPLETMVVNATYDNVNKAIILTLQNGITVSISVADLVSGLVSESQLQTILSNFYNKTEINNSLNNKVDKVQGKELSSNDFTDVLKEKLEGLENYDDREIKADISDIQDEQTEQNTDIEKLQEENARFKATLPTTTAEGQDITLDKTAELEFKKPPLPMGNSEQVQYSGKNKIISFKTRGSDLIEYFFDKSINNSFIMSGLSNLTVSGFKVTIKTSNGDINLGYKSIETNKNFSFTFSITTDDLSKIQNSTSTPFIQFWSSNGFAEVDFKNVMIRDSSITDDTYEPYVGGTASPNPEFESPITNVTGDVEVVVENKNLILTKDWMNATISSDGSYNTTSSQERLCSTYIPIDIGKDNLTFSFNTVMDFFGIAFYDEDKNYINRAYLNQNNKITSQILSNSKYVKVFINKSGLILNGNSFEQYELQLEYNTTSTDYVEHKSQTFIFPLGNEKLMLGDYLADDGIHHMRGQGVLDGTEAWFLSGYSDDTYLCAFSGKFDGYIKYDSRSLLCNTFVKGFYTDVNTKECIENSGNTVNLKILKSRLNEGTLNGLKTWLAERYSNNMPVIVEYPLAQEVIVPYTSAQQEVYNQIKQALSYEEQTNIRGSSNGSNPIFSVEGYQSTKLVLEDFATAIVALGGV